MSQFPKFCCALFMAGVLAGWLNAADEAAPAAEPKEAAAADAKGAEPKAAGDEKAPAPKTEPSGPLPKLPLQSEYFDIVFDSTQPEDAWENNAIQQIEMQPTAEILSALKASTHEHLVANISQNIKYKELMKTPEKLRGQVVQVRGLLETIQKFPLPENKSGEVLVWRGQISNMSGQIYTFFSLQEPDKELIKKPVRLTGIFLKRYAYKNRLEGEKLTWTPALFVRNVEAFSENEVYQGKSPMSGVTALIVAVLVLLVAARIGYKFVSAKNKPQINHFTRIKQKGDAPPAGKFPRPKSSKPKADEAQKHDSADAAPADAPPKPETGASS